jgi:hypothetical protein
MIRLSKILIGIVVLAMFLFAFNNVWDGVVKMGLLLGCIVIIRKSL